MGAGGGLFNMSPMLRSCRDYRYAGIQKWPRKPGPFVQSIIARGPQRKKHRSQKPCICKASEAEIGKIAIAQRGAGRGHQQTVDRGHQAAKQGGGGRKPDRSSLGHCGPLFQIAAQHCISWGLSTYTRCQLQRVCLHSSNLSFATQHSVGNCALRPAKQAIKREAAGKRRPLQR